MSTPNPSTDLGPAQQGATRRSSEKNSRSSFLAMYLKSRELSQRQLNAIDLLLRGYSDAHVAEQIGVDRGTIFRWRKNPQFMAELDRQRQILVQNSAARVQSMLEPALDVLQKQISGDDPKTALRAAAILVRVATPARLTRMSNPDESHHRREQERDELDDLIDNYVNAPMPNEPGHPAYERWKKFQNSKTNLQNNSGQDNSKESLSDGS